MSPADLELLSYGSIVQDLIRAMERLSPGALDRGLHAARIRLQLLEAGQAQPTFSGEDRMLRHKVSIMEQALGRLPPEG
ncbi:hypothetical protein [Caulobacter sp. 1776]|uniref:hypothetical protein n=1 Tax=Caulobacter sp. 1776 TaxID=3156420 RepID=UPI00339A303B